MDVNSVSRPVVQTATPPKRNAVSRQEQGDQKAQKAAPTQNNNPERKAQPVINTQGQVTGRHINVTA